ncbi:MAG: type II toxin-antitoxin system VapC family toxin [Tagaea sp.]|nr:type II toxin-antitoxin system VapC family toxin [Tagaea sp.]
MVDSSALLAIVLAEPDASRFAARLSAGGLLLVSAVTLFEATMVAQGRRGRAGLALLDSLLRDSRFAIVPFDAGQAALARDAFLRYGKGRHVAALNFGDCMAYALAKSLDLPLLHKGSDFAATDLKPP